MKIFPSTTLYDIIIIKHWQKKNMYIKEYTGWSRDVTFTIAFLIRSQIPLYCCLPQSKMLPHWHSTYIFLSRKFCTLLIKCQLHPCHRDMKNFRFNVISVLLLTWISLVSIYLLFFILEYWAQDTEDAWHKSKGDVKKKKKPRNKYDRFSRVAST